MLQNQTLVGQPSLPADTPLIWAVGAAGFHKVPDPIAWDDLQDADDYSALEEAGFTYCCSFADPGKPFRVTVFENFANNSFFLRSRHRRERV